MKDISWAVVENGTSHSTKKLAGQTSTKHLKIGGSSKAEKVKGE